MCSLVIFLDDNFYPITYDYEGVKGYNIAQSFLVSLAGKKLFFYDAIETRATPYQLQELLIARIILSIKHRLSIGSHVCNEPVHRTDFFHIFC